jgi:hypothetical protein
MDYNRDFTAEGKVIPDQEDYLAIQRKRGRLPDDASDVQCAEQYRLAQAHKLIRLYGPDQV